MFDMTRLNTKVLDQLRPWRIYVTELDLTTADGQPYPRGAEFRFEYAIANAYTRDAEIHGLNPAGEPVVFHAKAGEYRQWFTFTGQEWREGAAPKPEAPPIPAAIVAKGSAGFREWIATQPAYVDAHGVLNSSAHGATDWFASRRDGDILLRAARTASNAGQQELAAWLADRSLDFYHSWMSQATSGGEGCAMQNEIREELAEARKISSPR